MRKNVDFKISKKSNKNEEKGEIKMLERIKNVLNDKIGCDTENVTAETTLAELGIDSLDTMELVVGLEDEFEVELDFGEAKVGTIGDIMALIEKGM